MIRPQDPDAGWQEPHSKKISRSDMNESRECYYDALEARTTNAANQLLMRALQLDPSNTDARLLLPSYNRPKSIADEIIIYTEIVQIAEERLGEQAFQEFAGHFWGFHETRP